MLTDSTDGDLWSYFGTLLASPSYVYIPLVAHIDPTDIGPPRPTSTLSSIWLHMIPQNTNSPLRCTLPCIRLFARHTICKVEVFITGIVSYFGYRWDTAMSQKSRFKMQTQGNFKYRWTFPQLPWGTIENPEYIQTAHGCVAFDRPPA